MKTASLIQEGKHQRLALPEEYQFKKGKVYINKIGNIVALIPEDEPWNTLFESLELFTDDFMDTRNQSQAQMREELFT